MKNFKIYKIKTSFLNIHYNVNPMMNILILSSFASVFSRNIRQAFNFVLRKNMFLTLRLSLYFQSLHLTKRFQMVSYSGMHRHASYKNICYTLFGMDDCCIEVYANLSSKYENNFFFLSNKAFNNILTLQFIEYFSIPLERTLSSSVGSARARKKRNLFLGMEYFFLDF